MRAGGSVKPQDHRESSPERLNLPEPVLESGIASCSAKGGCFLDARVLSRFEYRAPFLVSGASGFSAGAGVSRFFHCIRHGPPGIVAGKARERSLRLGVESEREPDCAPCFFGRIGGEAEAARRKRPVTFAQSPKTKRSWVRADTNSTVLVSAGPMTIGTTD